ncbi:MAG: hypothetical protein KAQ94_04085 [Arcobacteraceae bacterium]|nr:hypothetical protein [Arcobacteraceae bacterium]
MNHLLYSSNEMYSSTELIRKSKTIFNKILSEEIDKAIILRDGKPSFMLLNFDKYEKIMAEYDILKAKDLSNNDTKINTKKVKKNKKDKASKNSKKQAIEIQKTKIIEQVKLPKDLEKKIIEVKNSIKSAQVIPPTPIYEEEVFKDEIEETIMPSQEDIKDDEGIIENDVKEGLEVLKDLDFDDKFRKEVERKVRLKKEREFAVKKEEDAKEEKIIKDNENLIKKEKQKTQLKEFWA